MSAIFRYHFPGWPPQYDGREFAKNLGTFDFERTALLSHLETEREDQKRQLHLSASRRETFAILEQTITDIEALPHTPIAEWHPASRDLPIEEKQRQNRECDETNITPAHIPDLYLGFSLQKLIYRKQFLRVLCPTCNASFGPEECDLKQWIGDGWGGYRFSCPHAHTLLCDNSICVTSYNF